MWMSWLFVYSASCTVPLQFSAPVNSIFQLLMCKPSHSLYLVQHSLCMGGYRVFCFLSFSEEMFILVTWPPRIRLAALTSTPGLPVMLRYWPGFVSSPQGLWCRVLPTATDTWPQPPSRSFTASGSTFVIFLLYLKCHRKDANAFNSQRKHSLFLNCLHG